MSDDESYDWQNLGSATGADEDYIGLAYVARDYGPFGYTLPPVGYTYHMVYDIGTPGCNPLPRLRWFLEQIAAALRRAFPRFVWERSDLVTHELDIRLDPR